MDSGGLSPRQWGHNLGEIVVGQVNWQLIALVAIGVLAVANVMVYLRDKRSV